MIEVVAGILINSKNEVLIAKRKSGKHLEGFWEFPGGKMEKGEDPKESLRRELMEEMSIHVDVEDFLCESIYDYGDKVIKLIGYKGRIARGDIHLVDHDEFRWVDREYLLNYKLAPADIPLVEELVYND
ncbi:(deoxy)nucleoside triphosphate pyrophosphohydrolase [Sporosalibacterium faouarense]|uniref:(deoxy)nucleoside triphosphate pyrophosphohydrolase n=1 Tax=Sporosalibacterium faouarense TaxID=516123 RepID=UPI00192C49FB|nr:(deoxy)nucleoside triphosphate pyrophosphohydrolase [Sporosalibacterium faouarense]